MTFAVIRSNASPIGASFGAFRLAHILAILTLNVS